MLITRFRVQRTSETRYVEMGTGRYWRHVEGEQPRRCIICGHMASNGWYAEGGERAAPQFRCEREARIAPQELVVDSLDGVNALFVRPSTTSVPSAPSVPSRRVTTPQEIQPKVRLVRTVHAGVQRSRYDARRTVYRANCEYRTPEGQEYRFAFEIEPDRIHELVIPNVGTPDEVSRFTHQWL